MKRFYDGVSVAADGDGWTVRLDDRPVRTPARAALIMPTPALADAVAAEWAAQDGVIRPATMPLTGLANAAIDRIAPERAAFAAGLAAYAATDLLAYRADAPAPLVARQAAAWDPLLAWLHRRYDVALVTTTGLAHVAQPPATLARIDSAYAALDAFRLAALAQVVTICGSAVIGLAVLDGALDTDAAWAAGQLDELWQAEQWGRDPLAEAAQAERQASLAAAARLLRLV